MDQFNSDHGVAGEVRFVNGQLYVRDANGHWRLAQETDLASGRGCGILLKEFLRQFRVTVYLRVLERDGDRAVAEKGHEFVRCS